MPRGRTIGAESPAAAATAENGRELALTKFLGTGVRIRRKKSNSRSFYPLNLTKYSQRTQTNSSRQMNYEIETRTKGPAPR